MYQLKADLHCVQRQDSEDLAVKGMEEEVTTEVTVVPLSRHLAATSATDL